jgi:hypothetical protein
MIAVRVERNIRIVIVTIVEEADAVVVLVNSTPA